MTRDQLLARLSDVIRRSGVDDAEELIAEVDKRSRMSDLRLNDAVKVDGYGPYLINEIEFARDSIDASPRITLSTTANLWEPYQGHWFSTPNRQPLTPAEIDAERERLGFPPLPRD